MRARALRATRALLLCCAALAWMTAPNPALAASDAPQALDAPLTLKGAAQTALEGNPTVRSARLRFEELEQRATSAVSAFFPTLSANLGTTFKKDPLTNPFALFGGEAYTLYGVGLQLVQPIPLDGGLFGQLKSARAGRDLAALDLQIAERDLQRQVVEAYFSVLLAQRRVASLERNLSVQNELLELTKRRQRIGRSQALDVLQIRTGLALLEPKIAQARGDVLIATTALASVLGKPDLASLALGDPFNPIPLPALQAKLKNLKEGQAPQPLEAQRAELEARQLDGNRSTALARHWPQLSAVGGWSKAAYTVGDVLAQNSTTWNAGLQLTVPIFSGLSSVFERKALSAQTDALEQSRLKTLHELSLAQVQTQKNVELSWEATASSKRALELGTESLKEAHREFKLATVDYVQTLQSEQAYLEAELSYDQSKYDYLTHLGRYLAAWGYPLETLWN